MIHFNGRLAPIFIDACLGSKRPGKPPPYITPERSLRKVSPRPPPYISYYLKCT